MKNLAIIIIFIFLAIPLYQWRVASAQTQTSNASNLRSADNLTPSATLTVTKTDDTNDGICDASDCSLREAIAAANASAANEVIEFNQTLFATPQTITLTLGTQLEINNNGSLTINSTGFHLLTLNGNNTSRVFRIQTGANVLINGVTITNGGGSAPDGAGISSVGNLILTNSFITNNKKGGLFNGDGEMSIVNVSVTNNTQAASGGGLFNGDGTVHITNSNISGNATSPGGGGGGGIVNIGGVMTIDNSNVSSNTTQGGGGAFINFSGTLIINNSTVSNNSTVFNIAGGILNNIGTVHLNHATIANNTASGASGGIRNQNGGTVNAHNSIIANNLSNGTASDIDGMVASQGYNLIESTNGTIITGAMTGNILGQDPMLGHLQFSGGATQTLALLAGSPAIDAANVDNFSATDQRGALRPLDGDQNGSALPDIGAFEVGAKVVTKIADTSDGTCDAADCSLREAITEANNSAADDTILFSALFNAGQTIVLNGSDLTIANNGRLLIAGMNATFLTISGNSQSRTFYVNAGANLTIKNMTLRNGNGRGFLAINSGGAIYNLGTLNINNVNFSNNTASIGGGAIYNSGGSIFLTNSNFTDNTTNTVGGGAIFNTGILNVIGTTLGNNTTDEVGGGAINNTGGTLMLSSSVVANNKSFNNGGGLYNTDTGSINVSDSVISGNMAQTTGGGINNSGTAVVTNSTINGNTTSFLVAGGIYNGGTLTALNSTVTGNTGTDGGGLFNGSGSTANITNLTVTNNQAIRGGGIRNDGTLNVRNTIVADNTATGSAAHDVSGTINSQGYNLIENTTDATITGVTTGNILGHDPQLMPLANYGGTTNTLALEPTSPAIDAGDPNDSPATDQRGIARPQDGDLNGTTLPDIGAYERQVFAFTVTKTADTNDGVCNSSDCSLREAIAAATATVGPDTAVVFETDLFATARTIILANADLQIVPKIGTLLINGRGTNLLTISGNNQRRVVTVLPGGSLTLVGATITNGTGISTFNNGHDGGISNFGRLTVNRVVVAGNSANGNGGGIGSYNGVLNVINSTVRANSARTIAGGGIFISNCIVTVTNSTLSNNTAGGDGGGFINIGGTVALTSSTISGNTSGGGGGGISNFGSTSVLNISSSTISNNIVNNSNGGGIGNFGSGTVNVRNTIIADNTATGFGTAHDFSGALNSQGYNLIERTTGATINGTTTSNILEQDPQLLPLGNYGGLTQTHAPRIISPAIDKGNNFGLVIDQRGMPRPYNNPNIPDAPGGSGTDIGAFERQIADFTPKTLFDYDGDGRADVSVFRPSNATWYLNRSTSGFAAIGFGLSSDKIVPSDYDGDGKTDKAVFRDGNWYVLRSSDNSFSAVFFGQTGDIPIAGDFDGDNRADQAVFRNGTWYLNRSTLGFASVQFGLSTDKPVAADYDGDGKTDTAVYRDGTWYYLKSSDGAFVAVAFGNSSDVPVAADYDGDGKDDQAVYRNGIWYLNRSSAGFAAVSFGMATDKPVPADYDGDGKADVTVYRDGNWYIQQSTSGFSAQLFGQNGDQPTPSAFIP